MIRRPPRSTLFPTRRSSDLRSQGRSRELTRPRRWGKVLLRADLTISLQAPPSEVRGEGDRKSTRLNSSHLGISYAVFCLKKKKKKQRGTEKQHCYKGPVSEL